MNTEELKEIEITYKNWKLWLFSIITLFLIVIGIIGMTYVIKIINTSRHFHYAQANHLNAQADQIREVTKPIKRSNEMVYLRDYNRQKECDKKYGEGKKFCWS